MSQLAATAAASEVFRLPTACIDTDALSEIAAACSDMVKGDDIDIEWPADVTVCITAESLILTDNCHRRLLTMGYEETGFYTACAYLRLLRNVVFSSSFSSSSACSVPSSTS